MASCNECHGPLVHTGKGWGRCADPSQHGDATARYWMGDPPPLVAGPPCECGLYGCGSGRHPKCGEGDGPRCPAGMVPFIRELADGSLVPAPRRSCLKPAGHSGPHSVGVDSRGRSIGLWSGY